MCGIECCHGHLPQPWGQPLPSVPGARPSQTWHWHSCFEADYPHLLHLLTDCWIQHVWLFVHTHQIILASNSQYIPPQCQIGDEFIMDLLEMDPCCSAQDLHIANHCHMKGNILTLANIMSGDGCYLLDMAFGPPPTSISSSYLWPEE